MCPKDTPPADSCDLRIIRRQQACGFTRATAGKKPRAPSLRSLVKLALKRDSAEQMGQKLRERCDRQQRRRGIATGVLC